MKKQPKRIFLIHNKDIQGEALFLSYKVLKAPKVCLPFSLQEAVKRRKELIDTFGAPNKKLKIYKVVEMTEKEVKELTKKKATKKKIGRLGAA